MARRARRCVDRRRRDAGRACSSGTALIVALILATAIAPTPILTSLGIGVLLCSALATGAAVVVMPAVLTLLGRRIDAFCVPRAALPRARLGLARRPRALGDPLGRPRRRDRHRGAASRSRCRPATSRPGRPTSSMLPASTQARQAFERVSAVMGPGWPTPFNVVVVSNKQPITAPALLRADPRPTSAASRATRASTPSSARARSWPRASDLKALPKGLEELRQAAQGRQEGPRPPRSSGLGQAGDGASQLRSGLASAADGAGQLQAGSGTAGSGAGKLHAGLGQARAGALTDLRRPARRAGRRDARCKTAPAAGARRAREQLAGGLGQAAKPVRDGLPVVQAARRATSTTASVGGDGDARRGAVQHRPARRGARAAAVDDGRQGRPALRRRRSARCPRPARPRRGVAVARSAASSPKLAGAAGVSATAAEPGGRAVRRPRASSTPARRELQGGIAKLRKGNADLAAGIAQAQHAAAASSRPALGALATAPPRSRPASASSPAAPGELQSGLAGGQGPTGPARRRPRPARGRRREVPRRPAVDEGPRAAPARVAGAVRLRATSCSRRSQGAPAADQRTWPRSRSTSTAAATPARSWSCPRRPPRTDAHARARRGPPDARPPRSRRPRGTEVAVGGPAGDLARLHAARPARGSAARGRRARARPSRSC